MRKTKEIIKKLLLTFFSLAIVLNIIPVAKVFAEEGSLHVTYYDGYTNTGATFIGWDGKVHGLLYVTGPDGVRHNCSTSGFDINGEVVFCIQPDIYTENGYYYTSDGNIYNHLTDSQARKLEMISWFGYGYNGDYSIEARIATQLVIWQSMGFTITGMVDSVAAKMNTIKSRVNEYNNKAVPSFSKMTHTLYGIGEEYAITLTDTNNVVSSWYKTSSPDGLSYEINGNTIKVWANKDIAGTKTINYDLIDPNDSRQAGASVIYVNPNNAQKLVKLKDPFKRYTDVSFRLVTGSFNLTKADNEVGSDGDKSTPQGDATFDGAQYSLINDRSGEVFELTYDMENGISNTIDHLDIRDTYTLKETKAPEGYLTDKTEYKVSFADDGVSSVIKVRKDLFDDVIKFNLALYKVTTDGEESESIPPVSSAEFTLTLKSSGEVVAVKETDHNGQLTFDNIPYGLYTITETKTPEGLETIKPFDFDGRISEEEHTYTFHRYANDAPFKAWVGIYKVDGETGKKIPAAGIEFKVKNSAGEYITQTVSYQTRYETDTFITNEDGFVNLPEKLVYGKYTICEIKAPYGYVLAKEEYPFNVDGSETEIFIEFENKQQYGQLCIEKYGEMLADVETSETEYGTLYTPVYQEMYLEGVTYQITAREDIVGQEGTVFFKKGDVVDSFITGNDITKSELLHLGAYTVKEIASVYGYVLDENTYDFDIEYAGQTIEIVQIDKSFKNERQKLNLQITKTFEDDDPDAYKDVVFGIYTNEEIIIKNVVEEPVPVLMDYEVIEKVSIPADSLVGILTIDENGNNLEQIDLPEGNYYIKELKTNVAFVLNEEEYGFEFIKDDSGEKTINVSLQPIHNAKRRLDIEVEKVDADHKDHLLDGAIFEVYDKTLGKYVATICSGRLMIKDKEPNVKYEIAIDELFENIIMTAKTDSEGEIILELDEGTYYSRKATNPVDEEIVPASKLSDRPVTRHVVKHGKAVLTEAVYGHEYEFKEMVAPTSYSLNKKPLIINAIADRETTTITESFVNHRIEIPNTGI